ncbi:MAG: SAM-dependent chlorinase/fluorinase [Dehalococcoidia bacterium]
MSNPIITLTTDFGLSDACVAAMKGVILGINQRATLVDISHEVRPQQILQAAFLTQSAWPHFPPEALHLAVVDPGVGTERSALALQTPGGRFVGPDNGVLSSALPDEGRPNGDYTAREVELLAGHRAFAITNERYLRAPVSATFHGRDVFAPAAAHLSLDVPIEDLGDPVESVLALPPLRASRDDAGLRAQVIHIDRFGNVVLDARAEDAGPSFAVEIAGQLVPGPVRTYAEASGLAAVVGSAGYLEIVLPSGNAAQALDVDLGEPAFVRASA